MKKAVFWVIAGFGVLLTIFLSLILKVPNFWVFLGAYLTWLILLSGLLENQNVVKSAENFPLIWHLLRIVVSVIGMFICVWSLSGFFDLHLTGLFLLVESTGIIVVLFLRLLFINNSIWKPQRLKLGKFEEEMEHYWVIGCILPILSLIMLVLYPVVMWKIYTSYSISSALATLTIFKWTLVWDFVSNIGSWFPIIFVLLISEKLDENTRTRTLVSLIVWLFPSAFYFALILGLFGFAGTDYSLTIGITSLSISPILVVIFMFLLLGYLVPYIWGWKRATKWRQGLLQKQRDWVEKTLGILEEPNPSRYTSELEELQAQMSNEAKQFIEGDQMVQLWLKDQTERDEVSDAMRSIIRELERDGVLDIMDSSTIRELQHVDDPRFSYFESLANLSKEVEEIIKQLSGDHSDTDKLRKAGCYSDKYRSKKEDIAKEIATEKQTMPRLVIGFGLVFAAAATFVINEVSKNILEMLRVSIGT
ncbi:MAG: hypothetical protein DRR08_03460 [Candidatus Parabeggiatoa sp. nov. 2]|nr:MAG: hypothetical protein DRR08_03460 [Gammaproteobacteria bacterium]